MRDPENTLLLSLMTLSLTVLAKAPAAFSLAAVYNRLKAQHADRTASANTLDGDFIHQSNQKSEKARTRKSYIRLSLLLS